MTVVFINKLSFLKKKKQPTVAVELKKKNYKMKILEHRSLKS